MKDELSIVIPTRDRPEILALTLAALEGELRAHPSVEVVVVDDGSRTSLEPFLRDWAIRLPLTWRRQPPRGPAAARNLGASIAEGRALLFLGDDIIPQAGFVGHHLRFHREHPEPEAGMLGRVTWDPAVRVTPFLRWLENCGVQFGYAHLQPGERVDFRYFYTSNVSLKRSLFERAGGFDERFPLALYEDTECAFRLEREGLQLVYRPEALGHHRHPTSFADAAAREKRKGELIPLLMETAVGPVLFPDGAPSPAPATPAYRALRGLRRALWMPFRLLADTRVPLPPAMYWRLLKAYGI